MDWIQINPQLFSSFPPDSRYLVGVSGGRDSIALLDWLIHAGYRRLIVCHLNHQLRGRSSNADARFVEKLAAKYDNKIVGQALRLPGSRTGKRSARPTTRIAHIDPSTPLRTSFELGSANVRALAKRNKTSIETAARNARYSFFATVAKRRRCHTIFLAHHADDLVETFLINLFRGAGATGLAGMREVSTRRIEDVDLTIVRPLLSVWRDKIDSYVRERRLKFREDASNKNLAPLRNRIRHRVIPHLEKTLGRKIRQNIWRTAMITADEENWIDNQLPVSAHHDDQLKVRDFRGLPIALQRRAILKWLRAQNVSEIGFDVIERARSLLDPAIRVAKVNLAQDRHLRRRAGKIFVD
ncbi:MAG TPA: tRNA lysidine(34) synthetase TilS [Candidatus Baltobacteraceae bacterium]|nr:tRNA lysidine(34) synthetase TilS [Candidatus Baltobacteraceae bacterium]